MDFFSSNKKDEKPKDVVQIIKTGKFVDGTTFSNHIMKREKKKKERKEKNGGNHDLAVIKRCSSELGSGVGPKLVVAFCRNCNFIFFFSLFFSFFSSFFPTRPSGDDPIDLFTWVFHVQLEIFSSSYSVETLISFLIFIWVSSSWR